MRSISLTGTGSEGRELALEGRHEFIAGRIQRVMLLPRREVEHGGTLCEFESGYLIADDFDGRGDRLPNDAAHAPQDWLHALRLSEDVLFYRPEVRLGHRRLRSRLRSCSDCPYDSAPVRRVERSMVQRILIVNFMHGRT